MHGGVEAGAGLLGQSPAIRLDALSCWAQNVDDRVDNAGQRLLLQLASNSFHDRAVCRKQLARSGIACSLQRT